MKYLKNFTKDTKPEVMGKNIVSFLDLFPCLEYHNESVKRVHEYINSKPKPLAGKYQFNKNGRIFFELEPKDKECLMQNIRLYFDHCKNDNWLNTIKESGDILVISRNIIDFLFCSTKQNFSSCLSLESEYHASYGLPMLAANDNIFCCYLAKGSNSKSKNYRNYKTREGKKRILEFQYLSMLARFFIYEKWENNYGLGKIYPQAFIKNAINNWLMSMFQDADINLNQNRGSMEKGLLLPVTKQGRICSVYYDDLCINISNLPSDSKILGRDGIIKLDTVDYSYNNGCTSLLQMKGLNKNFSIATKYADNFIFSEYLDYSPFGNDDYDDGRIQCSCCGGMIDSDEQYYAEDEYYCESCYNSNFFVCTHCNGVHHVDISVGYNQGLICEDCYDNYYTTCEGCDETILIIDSTGCHDGTYCEECYNDIEIEEEDREEETV